jgi:hypothetical protein
MFGMVEEFGGEMDSMKNTYSGRQYGPWQKEFVWCRKINDKWVFFRQVHKRYSYYTTNVPADYAIDDLELIRKTEA